MWTKEPLFDSRRQAEIGQRLQRLYDEVVNQEIPEQLQDLLDELDHRLETQALQPR